MANIGNLDQQIANLQINNHNDGNIEAVKAGKKVGPAVPPKPKKSQPQVGIFFFPLYLNLRNINGFFMHIHSLSLQWKIMR